MRIPSCRIDRRTRLHAIAGFRPNAKASLILDFVTWLGVYRRDDAGRRRGDNSTLDLDMDNAPQPDGYLSYRRERCGGRTRIIDRVSPGAAAN